jgi:hypothetical protein
MGQQQLLLLVLATVIVGLATVAGIQAFEQGQTRANQDALTQMAVKVASDIQAKAKEPSQFGGGDGSISGLDTGNLSIGQLGYDASGSNDDLGGTGNGSGVYSTSSGECIVSSGGSVGVSTGSGASAPSGDVFVECASDQNHVVVGVDGTDPNDINTNVTTTAS